MVIGARGVRRIAQSKSSDHTDAKDANIKSTKVEGRIDEDKE